MALDQTQLVKPAKKLRKLLGKLDRNPAPEQVHDLRTNARRFEAASAALALDDSDVSDSALKEVGRLRKRAGKVRDMDVLTEFAASVRPEGEEECQIRLLEHLGVRRHKQAKKLQAEIKQLRPGLRKDLDHVSSRMIKLVRRQSAGPADSAAGHAATHAVAHVAAMAVRLAAQLGTPPRLNRTNLHPYRLKVKDLRNILLLAEASSPSKFVEDLGEVKDAIGEWHDYAELVAIASKLLDHGGCLLLAELKRITESKYNRAVGLSLRLRRLYLKRSKPAKKNAANVGMPSPTVWEAMARLAG